jgi:hypothetical protein
MSVGDFWNGMQASSQAIVAPDTSIWGRAGHTTFLALDAATVLPLVGPAARAGSVAIRGATSAVKSSYAASAMLLNEASTLRAADMALTSAAAAAQPKTGFQVALGIIDPPTTAASLSNAELMKSVGLFGKIGSGAVTNIGASTQVSRLQLNTELALKELGILDSHGRLTTSVLEKAVPALRVGTALKNNTVIRELTKDGSQITDWQKLATPSVKLPSGQKVRVHFYQNRLTGEVNYTHHDFKVKNPVDVFVGTLSPQSVIEKYYPRFAGR